MSIELDLFELYIFKCSFHLIDWDSQFNEWGRCREGSVPDINNLTPSSHTNIYNICSTCCVCLFVCVFITACSLNSECTANIDLIQSVVCLSFFMLLLISATVCHITSISAKESLLSSPHALHIRQPPLSILPEEAPEARRCPYIGAHTQPLNVARREAWQCQFTEE